MIWFRQDDCTYLVERAMAGYDRDLYEDNCMNITEEEFVFDSLSNVKLAEIFKTV
jgi:hypothetical protein